MRARSNYINDPQQGVDNAGATIMVVEDVDETRFMIKLSLELSGYEVTEAASGQEAVEVARRERPDLILMDLDLPLFDSFAAVRRIREHSELRDIPIVGVTAQATVDYCIKALAVGCNECIVMPIDFDQLENLLDHLLHRN